MVKTKEIKEIREIKSKVKIIKEIERENNKQEDNFNEFLEIDRLRFLQTRKKTLNKNKVGEKLDGILDDEIIKDENKARDDLLKSRENLDDRSNDSRSVYTRTENDSVYKVNATREENSVVKYSNEPKGDNANMGITRDSENRDQGLNESRYSTITDNPKEDNRRKKAWEMG